LKIPHLLSAPISNISRIQPAYQKRLLKLGIKNLQDLFYHFPHRYDDFSKIIPISQIKLNENATVQGKIIEIKNIRTWKKRMTLTEAYLADESGIVKIIWFNQPFLLKTLKVNDQISISGKINFDKGLYFSNPSYEKIKISKIHDNKNYNQSLLRHTGRLVPVYPETAGLSSRYLRYLLQFFSPILNQIEDWLPQEVKDSQKLLNLKTALFQIHFPKSLKEISRAKRRLAFNELFLLQLFNLKQKINWQKEKAVKIPFSEKETKELVKNLPFKLTDDQRRAAWEIIKDLEKNHPMNRLLQGDVGSGKTVVAALAALQVARAGYQTALMAPTEILANQHYKTFCQILEKFNVKIGLITSGEKKINRKGQTADLLSIINNSDIIIGTHSLIQEKILFKKLALAIIDEQHRFGVNQRAALQQKIIQLNDGQPQTIPHLLSMTATPIPRTLTLALFGDLDISIISKMPPGRPKIITKIVMPEERLTTYNFIREQIKKGRQVFVICPRIETNNNNLLDNKEENRKQKEKEIKTVKEEVKKLAKDIFPEFRVAELHGQLKPKEKEKIMADFRNGKIDILVSTSVIEVGIDVPNATIMIIEGAERFGLAQLHQFRGRIGRGQHQSYCFLFSESASLKTNSRLDALLSTENGFALAEKDLQLRGPGDLYGVRQWGLPDLSMASLSDLPLIQAVRQEAKKILRNSPNLERYPALAKELKKFRHLIHLE